MAVALSVTVGVSANALAAGSTLAAGVPVPPPSSTAPAPPPTAPAPTNAPQPPIDPARIATPHLQVVPGPAGRGEPDYPPEFKTGEDFLRAEEEARARGDQPRSEPNPFTESAEAILSGQRHSCCFGDPVPLNYAYLVGHYFDNTGAYKQVVCVEEIGADAPNSKYGNYLTVKYVGALQCNDPAVYIQGIVELMDYATGGHLGWGPYFEHYGQSNSSTGYYDRTNDQQIQQIGFYTGLILPPSGVWDSYVPSCGNSANRYAQCGSFYSPPFHYTPDPYEDAIRAGADAQVAIDEAMAQGNSAISQALALLADAQAQILAIMNAPDTLIDEGPNGRENDGEVRFEFHGTGTATGFECRLDAGTWNSCSTGITLSPPGNAHTFEVRAINGQGQPDATPASRTWVVQPIPYNSPVDPDEEADKLELKQNYGLCVKDKAGCLPDNNEHTFCWWGQGPAKFDRQGGIQGATYAMENLVAQTIMNKNYNENGCDENDVETDVVWYLRRIEDLEGGYQCKDQFKEATEGGTMCTHGAAFLDPQDMHNHREWRELACHEAGHSVGMHHRTFANDCMQDPPPNQVYGHHSIHHVNSDCVPCRDD